MKHTRINIGLLILFFGLLCSSYSENTAVEWSYGESVPLGIEELRLEGITDTRAGGTPVTAEGATIAVFLTNTGGYTPMYNKTYTYSGGSWSSTDPICVDKRMGKVVGVYDPNGLVSFGANSTVAANNLQAQVYDETKLWYYDNTNGTDVNNTTPAAFSMTCAYSRLLFSISCNANYPLACKISQIVIKPSSGNFYTNARVNIADGSLTGTAVANYTINTSALPVNTTGIAAGATDTSIDYLFPAQACNGLTITLTVDGKDLSVTVPNSSFSAFAPGNRYTAQMELTSAGVSAVTIPDNWTLTNVNGGNSYIPVP